jgi:hypothetical protein
MNAKIRRMSRRRAKKLRTELVEILREFFKSRPSDEFNFFINHQHSGVSNPLESNFFEVQS